MNVLLLPFGSRGDIQPMLVLGLGLKERGYTVTVGTSPTYRQWIESCGLRFVSIGGDFENWLKQTALVMHNPFKLMKAFGLYVKNDVPLCYAQTLEAARDADMIIGTIHLAARTAAEALHKPYRTLVYTTSIVPSSYHPPLIIPWQNLPRWLNRLLWYLPDLAFNLLLKKAVNKARAELGCPPISKLLSFARTENPIVATDPLFMPLPPDVAEGPVQTGALMWPFDEPLDPTIETFLNRGMPPVYIGFGSMPDKSPDALGRMISEAVLANKARGIISEGWAGISGITTDERIITIGPAPHRALFPRTALIIHHGGAGTTAAALRSGVPQLIIPHSADQFYHGHLVQQHGIGPAPIKRSDLTQKKLEKAIAEVLGNSAMKIRAAEFGKKAAAVDTLSQAIKEIEKNKIY